MRVLVAHRKSDLRRLHGGATEKLLRFFHPHISQILDKGPPRLLAENRAEMIGA